MEIYAIKFNPQRFSSISFQGHFFVKYLAKKHLGITDDKLEFKRGRFGKPFLHLHPHFHFNLTYSSTWIICAIDNMPIGVDLEKRTKSILPIESLSAAEKQLFNKLPKRQKANYFYQQWTRKESFLKAKGIGLNQNCSQVSLLGSTKIKPIITEEKNIKYFIRDYYFKRGYACSVCTLHPNFTDGIKIIRNNIYKTC